MQDNPTFPSALTRVHARRIDARPIAWSNILVGVLLGMTMLIGGYFRFVGLNWDDFTHLHPDERFFTDVAQGLGRSLNPSGDEVRRNEQIAECERRYPETFGVGGYFDALCSTLNPLNANSGHGLYVYGTLPLFMARGAAELYGQGMEWYAVNVNGITDYDGSYWISYDAVHLVWRMLSALAEMGCIVFVFAIGVRLHDKWVGIVGAFLYAVTVFSIQMGHFATVDATANFFVALAIFAAVQIQRTGRLTYWLWFGFGFGCAIASRINVLPLFGLGVVVAIVRVYPILAARTPLRERDYAVSRQLAGLLIAGVVGFACFRVFNPYAFDGPGAFDLVDLQGGFPFITLHDRWLGNLDTAQELQSGRADSPPNYQWIGRTPYIYPLGNLILWGMGAPLGLACWIGFAFALWRLVRGKPGGLANALLLAWIIVYFGFFGRNWVTTMRYFLPIYPALTVLAAWAIVGAWRWTRDCPNWLRVAFRVALVTVPAFTLLWAVMFTNIYRNLLTRVAASHWVIENMPGDFAMRIDGAPQGTPLVNINIGHGDNELPLETRVSRLEREFAPRAAFQFTVPASGTISSIYAPHLGDPLDTPEAETLQFTIQRVPSLEMMVEFQWSSDLPRADHPVGNAYDIALPAPLSVTEGEVYEFAVTLIEGEAVISGGSILSWEGAWDDPIPTGVCRFPDGITLADDPPPGIYWDGRGCREVSPWNAQVNGYKPNLVYEDEPSKRIVLLETMQYSDYYLISSNRFYDQMARNPQRWPMTNLFYDKLFAGELGYDLEVMFQETFEFGPFRVSDQHLPFYDSPEWLQEFEAEEAFHVYDHPVVFIFKKRADYDHNVVLDALYSVPLTRVNDAPVFNNCEGSEKYYCDPTLVGPSPLNSLQAAESPTRLRLSEETRATQYSGGTWSDRFDADSMISLQPIVTIVAWWIVVLIFGWVTFPALWALLPGTSLRGYGYAKFAGMFAVGWGLWMLGSARLPVWSQTGVAVGLLGMALISTALVWRQRAAFGAWIRENRGRLAIMELITLIAFLAFVAVRLGNPDLWHPSYGGEKPMDFAYFNGVLRSTIFPPIDPWQAGGFLNYYYFGYVIVGSPVLLLKLVPSVAYNVIVPMLFALTAIAAYSVAYDFVAALRKAAGRWRVNASPALAGMAALLLTVVLGNLDTPRVFLNGLARTGGYSQPDGMASYLINRYVAENGAQPDEAALFELFQRTENPPLIDSVRYEVDNLSRMITGLAGGVTALSNGQQIGIGAERWFWAPTRILAETQGVEGSAITEMPIFTFVYGDLHAHMIAMPMQFLIVGLLFNEFLIAGRRHMRRRRADQDDDAEAVEPYETEPRSFALSAITVGVIGVTVGMLRATNTWDWITYLLLGGIVLTLAWWLAQARRVAALAADTQPYADSPIPGMFWRRFSRASLLAFVGSVGGYALASVLGVFPYTTYYTAIYNSIRLWTDGKTPLWAYFDIHGLFLFLVLSLLLWESGRWLRSTRVRALRGQLRLLVIGMTIVIVGLIAALVAALIEWQVMLIAMPLLLWTAILLLRPGQSRVMQFVLLLTGLAVGLTLGVEFIVLDGDIGRQNTVFKFYIQAWLLLSAVGGTVFAWMVASLPRWRAGTRAAWTTACTLLVFVAALLPVMAIQGKAVFRFDRDLPPTLDGAAFMTTATQYEGEPAIQAQTPEVAPFPLVEDYRLIRWMQDNLAGLPVILEGLSSDTQYRWNARISIYTGNPSVLGWNFHQRQQRTLEPMGRLVEIRNANINAFYQLPSIGMAWEMIDYYDVEYLVVGRLERAYFAAEGLAKFDRMVELGLLEVVYSDAETSMTKLYRVIPGAQLEEFG